MMNREGLSINAGVPRHVKTRVAVGIFLAWFPGCVTSPVYTLPSVKPDQPSCVHPIKP
jgi:hypothetical protein